MTALVGCVGGGVNLESMREAAASLLHVPWQRASVLPITADVAVGGVWMANRPDLFSVQRTASRIVVLAGRMQAGGLVLDAAGIDALLQRDGWASLSEADGNHVLLVLDLERRTLEIQNDPFGSIPLCYGHGEGGFAFGPEAKVVLRLLGRQPQIDRDSARQFLLNRYLLADRLMLAGVRRLPPGHRLSCGLDDKRVRLQRVWDLQYRHRVHRPAEAEQMLHEALQASHADMVGELRDGGGYQMFLTGGLDSRGVLGYARALDRLPSLALTWGADESVPASDAQLASRLAGLTATPWSFAPIDPEGWCRHARQWTGISELDSDNASSFATGAHWLSAWNTQEADFVVLGDQMIGAGAIPANAGQAVDNILRGARQALAGPVRSLLRDDAHAAAAEQFDAVIGELIANGPNDHPKDIQDYLYFHTYIARWILAPGNFKSPLFNVRRPLMTRAVMDVASTFAPALRVDKSVFVRLLQRRFADLMAVPKTAGDSNVQWRQALRFSPVLAARVRDGIVRLLEDGSPLQGDLEADRLLAFTAAFFAAPAAESAQQAGGDRLRRFAYDLRSSLSRLPGMDGVLRAVQPMVKRALGMTSQEDLSARHQVLMRLALLGLLQEAVDTGELQRPVSSDQRQRVLEMAETCNA